MSGYEYQKGGLSDDEYSELDYWQDVLYRAENEIEYWEGEKEIALEMIEKLQKGGGYNKCILKHLYSQQNGVERKQLIIQ